MKRVLACGGRDFSDAALLNAYLDRALAKGRVALVIHGGARGADSLAGEWAKANGVPVEVYMADWQTHGKAAGPIRNKRMLDEGKPDVVLAFTDGSGPGTANMMKQARDAGVQVVEVAKVRP